MKIQITATTEELRSYRNYKLDLLDGGTIDPDMEMISHILENSDHNLAQILANSDDGDDVTISKEKVTRSSPKLRSEDFARLLNNFAK